jgi:hypothetical protein
MARIYVPFLPAIPLGGTTILSIEELKIFLAEWLIVVGP